MTLPIKQGQKGIYYHVTKSRQFVKDDTNILSNYRDTLHTVAYTANWVACDASVLIRCIEDASAAHSSTLQEYHSNVPKKIHTVNIIRINNISIESVNLACNLCIYFMYKPNIYYDDAINSCKELKIIFV